MRGKQMCAPIACAAFSTRWYRLLGMVRIPYLHYARTTETWDSLAYSPKQLG